jgi:hypothetical protein
MSRGKAAKVAKHEPAEPRRLRGVARFRKAEVARVIEAAQKAGTPFAVTVDPTTGKIVASFGRPEDAAPAPNAWDKS